MISRVSNILIVLQLERFITVIPLHVFCGENKYLYNKIHLNVYCLLAYV